MTRLFIALPLDSSACAALKPAALTLGAYKKFLSVGTHVKYHLTIKFLGEKSSGTVQSLVQNFTPDTFLHPHKIDYTLRGIGAFPDTQHARVLWAGVNEPGGVIAQLKSLCETFCAHYGCAEDRNPFSPHITLARVKQYAAQNGELAALIADHKDDDYGAFSFNKLVLFSSELTPSGAQHNALSEIFLA